MREIVVTTVIETFLDVQVHIEDDKLYETITNLDKHTQKEIDAAIKEVNDLAEEKIELINQHLYEGYNFKYVLSAKTFGDEILFET